MLLTHTCTHTHTRGKSIISGRCCYADEREPPAPRPPRPVSPVILLPPPQSLLLLLPAPPRSLLLPPPPPSAFLLLPPHPVAVRRVSKTYLCSPPCVPPGAAQPGAPSASAGPAGPLPGPGTLGRQSGGFRARRPPPHAEPPAVAHWLRLLVRVVPYQTA